MYRNCIDACQSGLSIRLLGALLFGVDSFPRLPISGMDVHILSVCNQSNYGRLHAGYATLKVLGDSDAFAARFGHTTCMEDHLTRTKGNKGRALDLKWPEIPEIPPRS